VGHITQDFLLSVVSIANFQLFKEKSHLQARMINLLNLVDYLI